MLVGYICLCDCYFFAIYSRHTYIKEQYDKEKGKKKYNHFISKMFRNGFEDI